MRRLFHRPETNEVFVVTDHQEWDIALSSGCQDVTGVDRYEKQYNEEQRKVKRPDGD